MRPPELPKPELPRPELPRSELPKSDHLPVPSGPAPEKTTSSDPKARRRAGANPYGNAAVEANILSGGEKRGLKGGAETLKSAKSTYLSAEYSGPNDRRPKPGTIKKTEI